MKCTSIFNNFSDAFIVEFSNFSRTDVNEMVMLGSSQCLFKLGYVFPELMFNYQFAVKQDLYGLVQGCPADTVIFVFHRDIECLNVKMTVAGLDFIQDGIPLRRLPMPVPFKVLRENILYRFFVFLNTIHT